MSWVNLNDVYVNQTGGTIAGDLSVNGALTVNDGKGTNTTYNVANEITTLRNSVSQNAQNAEWLASRFNFGVDKITFWHNANGNFEIQFKTSKDNITLFFSRDMIGVYDANTITSKTVRLS